MYSDFYFSGGNKHEKDETIDGFLPLLSHVGFSCLQRCHNRFLIGRIDFEHRDLIRSRNKLGRFFDSLFRIRNLFFGRLRFGRIFLFL